jgi:hypothetical protein
LAGINLSPDLTDFDDIGFILTTMGVPRDALPLKMFQAGREALSM